VDATGSQDGSPAGVLARTALWEARDYERVSQPSNLTALDDANPVPTFCQKPSPYLIVTRVLTS
jgi:hypothetical protein